MATDGLELVYVTVLSTAKSGETDAVSNTCPPLFNVKLFSFKVILETLVLETRKEAITFEVLPYSGFADTYK